MIASVLATSFVAPWVLLALPALPLLWWLLRVTPPAPQREVFPAIRLLFGLNATAETPAHTPLWLLMLRIFNKPLGQGRIQRGRRRRSRNCRVYCRSRPRRQA